jgi:hypothetical protein
MRTYPAPASAARCLLKDESLIPMASRNVLNSASSTVAKNEQMNNRRGGWIVSLNSPIPVVMTEPGADFAGLRDQSEIRKAAFQTEAAPP